MRQVAIGLRPWTPEPHHGCYMHPSVWHVFQRHIVVVSPEPGVHRRTHLQLYTQQCHREAMHPGVNGLITDLELRCLAVGFHGLLHSGGDLQAMPFVVYHLLLLGLGNSSSDDRLRRVLRHSARDPIRGGLLPRLRRRPPRGYEGGAVVGKPHAEARDSFASQRPLLHGPLPEDSVARGADIPEVVVPQSLHRFIDFWGHNYLCDIPIRRGVHLHLGRGGGVTDAPAQDSLGRRNSMRVAP